MSIFRKRRTTTPDQPVLRCSFCNKAQAEVRKLIAGPTVFICDECVQVCNDIIRADAEEGEAKAVSQNLHAENEQSPNAAVAPPTESHSTHSMLIVTCKLCGLPLSCEDALVIPERGFLCPACSGEVEASLAQKREDVT